MAKRSSGKKTAPPRVTPAHTLPKVRAVVRSRHFGFTPMRLASSPPLRAFEDRRQWHPERWGRPVLGFKRAATRLVVPSSPGPKLTHRIAFLDPRRVIVCLRRKARREVLHALGKGGGGNPKRKPTSNIEC